MLNKISKIASPMLMLSRRNFGSSHGAPAKIQFNNEATWIKYKTTRRLAVVDGIEDTHIPLPDLLDVDPIAHTRNLPWYDEDCFFNGQIYYHSLDHQPNSSGQHGYFYSENPNQSRSDIYKPAIYTCLTIFTVFFFIQYSDIQSMKPIQQTIAQADHVQYLADKVFRQKLERIRTLQEQIEQIKNK